MHAGQLMARKPLEVRFHESLANVAKGDLASLVRSFAAVQMTLDGGDARLAHLRLRSLVRVLVALGRYPDLARDLALHLAELGGEHQDFALACDALQAVGNQTDARRYAELMARTPKTAEELAAEQDLQAALLKRAPPTR